MADERIQRMITDPDLGGDLLLLGLVLATHPDLGRGEIKLRDLDRRGWSRQPSRGTWAIENAVRNDSRRYRPPEGTWDDTCQAPMIRRAGPCGRGVTVRGHLTDWATGEKTIICACTRHRDWFDGKTKANDADRPASPPIPCANSGGVLARHFPEVDWPALWRKFDFGWVECPEKVPWPKPTLTLLVGDDHDSGPAIKPALAVVPALDADSCRHG